MKRFLYALLLIGSVLYAPWWVTLVVGGVGVFYFPLYLEVFAAGVLFDLLYGYQVGLPLGFGILGLMGSLVLYVSVGRFKANLRTPDRALL